MNANIPHLIDMDGYLGVAFDSIYSKDLQEWHEDDIGVILICVYDAGDCDMISWPMCPKSPELLRRALYDAREYGLIDGKATAVRLPNGETFDI